MPTDLQHLHKAEHNEAFYLSFDLGSTPYLDWVVNGIFYSAVHYLESYLATQQKHSQTHGDRNANIRDDPNLGRDIFKKFNSLKDDSENGRYFIKVFTPGEIQQYIIPNLYAIKEYLQKYIPQIRLA
jgi:hypothetical protein